MSLVAPEVKTDVKLAAFVEEPAEHGAEYGEKNRACDRPRIIADHQAGNNIADTKEYGGIQKNSKNSEGEDVQREREKQEDGPHKSVQKPKDESA